MSAFANRGLATLAVALAVAANALAQMIAAKTEKIILPYFFIPRFNVAPKLELRE